MSKPDIIVDMPGAALVAYRAGNGNELALDTKREVEYDPQKFRGGAYEPGYFLEISGDLLELDPAENNDPAAPRRLNKVALVLRVDDHPEAGQHAGCVEIRCQRAGTTDDPNSALLFRLTNRGAEFFCPVFAHAGFGPTGVGGPTPNPQPPTPNPPDPNPPPSTGPHGILVGDFAAVRVFYGFASEDEQPYREGRMSWELVIARMDARAA